MNGKICALLAGATLVALAGSADAGQPVALSDAQMDQVTGGFEAIALAPITGNVAIGNVNASTQTATATDATPTSALAQAAASANATSAGSQSLGLSTTLTCAAATTCPASPIHL